MQLGGLPSVISTTVLQTLPVTQSQVFGAWVFFGGVRGHLSRVEIVQSALVRPLKHCGLNSDSSADELLAYPAPTETCE